MATLTIKHFDVLAYVKKVKELGTSEELAEYQARQIEQLADTIQEQRQEIEVLKQLEPATKKDLEVIKLELQKEIAEVKNSLVKWVLGTGFIAVATLSGTMFTLLKLMIH